MDNSQMFKRVSHRLVKRALHGLAKRVEARWQCRAVLETTRERGKPTYTLIAQPFQRKGTKCWSFDRLEAMAAWTATLRLTRIGKHLLWRTTGVPMGASDSPIKASIVLSDCERRSFTAISLKIWEHTLPISCEIVWECEHRVKNTANQRKAFCDSPATSTAP